MPPINDALLNVGANAMGAAAAYMSLHTATPNTSGSNESAAPRVASSWGAAATGDITATNRPFTGGTANGAVVAVGFWSAQAAGTGTWYGYLPLTGDATFNSAGEYTVTSVTLNGSST